MPFGAVADDTAGASSPEAGGAGGAGLDTSLNTQIDDAASDIRPSPSPDKLAPLNHLSGMPVLRVGSFRRD